MNSLHLIDNALKELAKLGDDVPLSKEYMQQLLLDLRNTVVVETNQSTNQSTK